MISVYKIKPAFQKCLQPVLKGLYKMGITANQITIAAVVLSAGMGVSIGCSVYHPALILIVPFGYLLRMILNALDGMMATQYNMQSQLGEILNELGDVISDAMIIFPMVYFSELHPAIVLVFGVLAILNEFAGVLAKVISGNRRYDGPMGKSDRALLIGLYCLIYFFWTDIGIAGNWIFIVAAVLTTVSTIIRLQKSLK